VSTIEEGLEVLTGLPAGTRKHGKYKDGTVFGRADARLRELAEQVRSAERDGGPPETPAPTPWRP
jgi:hypothetical protein